MFRLRDLKNGMYQIHKTKGPAYEGTPYSIFQEAVKLGVKQEDLVLATHTLKETGYDYADFNDSGKFQAVFKGKK